MFTKVSNFSEIDLEKYGSFRLCYIDRIEEEIYNHPNSSDLRFSYHQTWIPNPEYIEGETDHYAFFTPVFDKQWGDDWNDAPYEHNAGYPYDETRSEEKDEKGHFVWVEHEILQVSFGVSDTRMWVKYPDDYGCGNSPFSVDDINHGAVAWIYGSGGGKYLNISGGITLREFIEKIEEINKNQGS